MLEYTVRRFIATAVTIQVKFHMIVCVVTSFSLVGVFKPYSLRQ
jgi:hypothetical protein